MLEDGTLVCMGMGSGSGSNLRELITAEDNYTVALLFSDRQCAVSDLALQFGKSFLSLKAKSITGNKPIDSDPNMYIAACERFEQLAIQQISAWEMQNQNIDLVLLGGYMRLLRKPFMHKFEGRMLNVHPGDLNIDDITGERLLIGSQAVLKALIMGHQGTRSCIHVVTHKMDGGPIVATSELVPFAKIMIQIREQLLLPLLDRINFTRNELNQISAAALEKLPDQLKKDFPVAMKEILKHCREHQEKQKQLADWPTYTATVRSIAKGEIKLPNTKQEGMFSC